MRKVRIAAGILLVCTLMAAHDAAAQMRKKMKAPGDTPCREVVVYRDNPKLIRPVFLDAIRQMDDLDAAHVAKLEPATNPVWNDEQRRAAWWQIIKVCRENPNWPVARATEKAYEELRSYVLTASFGLGRKALQDINPRVR